jgi:genome maintenance exonuclease 1
MTNLFSQLKKQMIQEPKQFNLQLSKFPNLPDPDSVYNIDDFEHPETKETGRHYVIPISEEEKLYFPSATNLLGQIAAMNCEDSWIDAWRDAIGHEAADAIVHKARVRGTWTHQYLEDYILGKIVSSNHPLAWKLFTHIKPMIDEVDAVFCLENALYSKLLRFAGRVDCIAELDGLIHVIDFKTSRKKKPTPGSYFRQVCLYAFAFRELTGEVIEFGRILTGYDADERQQTGAFHTDVIIADTLPVLIDEIIKLRQHQGRPLKHTSDQLLDFYFNPETTLS